MTEVTKAVRFKDGNMKELYKSMAAITKVIFCGKYFVWMSTLRRQR